MDKNKNLVIAVVVALLIAGAALYYFLGAQKPATQPQVSPLEKGEQGLGGQLYEKTGNPAQKVPDTNPFLQVQTNPLQGTNPFEGVSTNPFQ